MMLTDYYPPHTGGGVERVASELCHGLADRGHSVAALTLRTDPAPLTESDGNLTVWRAPAADLTPRLGIQLALSVHVLPHAIRLLRRFQPDVVHAHNLFFRTTEVAALTRMFSRVPLVTTLHLGGMAGGRGPLRAAVSAYEQTIGRLTLFASEHVIAVSSAVAEHARRLGRGDRPMTVIPNGVDTAVFHPAPEPRSPSKTVLFVGRLVSNKGPQTLVEAAPEVLNRHQDARFVFLGEGPLDKALRRRTQRLGIEQSVAFLGTRSDVAEIMRGAALLARPSTLEGMPLTVLEGMASGLPVVATPVGGTPELVSDGVTGRLVPPGDSNALASRIIELLDDPNLAAEMGRHGRERAAAGYTWERVIARTEAVYAQVTGQ